MLKTSCAALSAVLFLSPLTIRADEPEMETVLVTGEQPGPGLWKVSRDGHVMWVLGSIGAVPNTFVWRTGEVEARIAESQEVLYPGWPNVHVDIGAFEALTLIPAAFKAAKNPDGAVLKDVLSPEAYESWLRLKQKYLRDDDDIEKYRPMVAEEKLVNAIGKKAMKGLKLTPVHSVVNKAAKKHKVPIRQLPTVERKIEIEKPRAILKAARNRDLAEGECVGRNLLRIEKSDALGNFAFDVKSVNAWAMGDIEALRPRPSSDEDLRREDCVTASLIAMANDPDAALSPEMSRGIDLVKQQEELFKLAGEEAYLNWMAAAETALRKNVSTFAVLPMSIVLDSKGSWLAKLAEKGFVVEPPRG